MSLSVDPIHAETKPILTPYDIAYCHGEGPSGHPGIFLNLSPHQTVRCPYCSQTFSQVEAPAAKKKATTTTLSQG